MNKIVDYDQLFPGRFLKSGEFQGKDVTLTISDVETEELPQDNGGKRERGIISFVETKKKLVLNRTNGECIKGMFGRRPEEWKGKRITLYPAPYEGDDTCIRVKGSPDLSSATLDVEVKLPKKKPRVARMIRTGQPQPKRNARPAPASSPAPDPTPPDEAADSDAPPDLNGIAPAGEAA